MARIVAFTYDRTIDRRILLQMQSMQDAGHTVTLYAGPAPAGTPEGFDIVRIAVAPGRAGLLARAYRAVRRAAPGFAALALRYGRPLVARVADPAQIYTGMFADAIATAPKADLYIAYDLPMLPVAAAVVARHGGKLLYDSHELFAEQGFSEPERLKWMAMEAAYIGKANGVVTVNRSIADALQQRYGLTDVVVVHNAEQLPAQEPVKQTRLHAAFGLPEGARVVLYQGGLSAGRNLEGLVEAMRYVTQGHLVILGDGPMEAKLRALVKKRGLQRRVLFHAAVPQAQLLDYTMSADIGVIPYVGNCLNNQLCTPNKLFEFIAAGLPILASDLPELRRFVAGHQLGLLCDMADPHATARAIEAMLVPEVTGRLAAQVAVARQTVNWARESQAFMQEVARLV